MSALETHILNHVAARGADKSVCPSEVARAVFPADWRVRMEDVRQAARVLAKAGQIHVTQGDNVLDPEEAWVGPVRLRRGQK